MAAFPLIAAIAGGALSAVGSIQQANAQSSAAKFNARMGEQNAILAEQQAAEDERLQRLKGRKAIGATRAGFGASGVNLEGSPQDVLEESAAAIELDALKIRHEGQIRANAYRSGAALDRAQGAAARTSGYLSATSALLNTGINVYDRLYDSEPTPKRTG